MKHDCEVMWLPRVEIVKQKGLKSHSANLHGKQSTLDMVRFDT